MSVGMCSSSGSGLPHTFRGQTSLQTASPAPEDAEEGWLTAGVSEGRPAEGCTLTCTLVLQTGRTPGERETGRGP